MEPTPLAPPELSGVVLTTERVVLRRIVSDDAAFIFGLLNEPAWLRFIDDKGVRTLDDARRYIATGPQPMYREHGFGLWLVETKMGATPIGICGLIKRPGLEDVDLGFAYREEFQGQGFARESASAALRYAREVVGLKRIVALTALDNERSIRLLEKLGFAFERILRLKPDGPESRLFALTLSG